jgi:hypothetical protein
MTKRSQLQKIYAKIPKIDCKGLCHESCGVILVSDAEHKILKKKAGVAPSFNPTTLTCNLLKDGRCTAYRDRPFICRLWGVVKGLKCPYGCEPEKWLTKEEGDEIKAEIEVISGKKEIAKTIKKFSKLVKSKEEV